MKAIAVLGSLLAAATIIPSAAVAKPPTDKAPVVAPIAFYASSGQLVGPMISDIGALIRVEGMAAAIFLNNIGSLFDDGATWVPNPAFYGSSGCTGSVYINRSYLFPGVMAVAQVVITLDGKYMLFAGPTSGRTSPTITYSRLNNGVCSEEPTPVEHPYLYPVTTIVDLSSYQLPLVIK